MNKIGIAITAALAASLTLGATAANAQSWGYDRWQADQAHHSADVRADQARRDMHAADEAAAYGDYGAAQHYAHEADKHRYQAWRDEDYARHEDRAARWGYWRGY
jgi:hypothetical protein